MSKLIAFRLPDRLLQPFERRCEKDGLGASAALVMLVERWVDGEAGSLADAPKSPPKLTNGRGKTVTVAARKGKTEVAPAKRELVEVTAVAPKRRVRPPDDVIAKMKPWERRLWLTE